LPPAHHSARGRLHALVASGIGQVVSILRELPSEKPANAATLEIVTSKNELVAMLTSPESGRARYSLKEGSYRLRVSHPRFDAEHRTIHVTSGQTAEVRIEMKHSAAGSTPLGSTVQAVDEGVGRVSHWGARSMCPRCTRGEIGLWVVSLSISRCSQKEVDHGAESDLISVSLQRLGRPLGSK